MVHYESSEEFRAGISFSWNNMRVYVHKKTLKALGYPEYARFLFDIERQKFCIQASRLGESGAFPLRINSRTNTCEINSMPLILLVWEKCKLRPGDTYRYIGIAHRRYRLVEFTVSEGECVFSSVARLENS